MTTKNNNISPLFILLFALCSSASAQPISLNSSLTPTGSPSSWLSPSGLYAFGFYKLRDGAFAVGVFMAGVPGNAVVWTANREDPVVGSNATFRITDTDLTLRLSESQVRNVVHVDERIGSVSMNDSGNFIIYNSAGKILWQSFDHPSDTLLPGQVLAVVGDRQQLFSGVAEDDPSKGPYRLVMQDDGLLRLYPSDSPNSDQFGYWDSGPETYQSGKNISLQLDENGYMYMKNGSGIIHNLTNGGFPDQRTIYRAKIDLDGIFRLYAYSLDQRSDQWTVKFATNNNKCEPKGVCGFNSFCINIDLDIECKCLAGFEYAYADSNRTCSKMSSPAQGGGGGGFEMKPEENTLFLNDSYRVVRAGVQEECNQACLEDGNCEAALFNGGFCAKQRLPLRYGRRKLGEPTVTLVKVASAGGLISTRKKKKELRIDILIISVCLFVVSLAILSAAAFLVCVKRAKEPNRTRNYTIIKDVAPKAFTYAELEKATNGFEDGLILGRGAFGTVYKATLRNCERMAAVKRLGKVAVQGGGEREFENEMAVIGRTHHRNLVRLLGYCIDGARRLLVYEYMRNGSLADVLFAREKNHPPKWDDRIRMACDIARGIQYLHEECETQIIHCDIKPENILMDEFFRAKISDFGLAKLLKHDQTKTFTAIRGTKGYVAPEWHQKLPVTVKADVYSFGIVLLEIVCVRKSVDWSFPEDEAVLEEWAFDAYEANEVHKLVANNDEVVDMRKVERVVKIAMWCIQVEPSLRPTMKKALMMLEGTVDIPIPPNPTSFFSTAV